MAKILVADDNSNVQKTVALALADLGVEVVSVNNGEAAVRKLADISPDLVLADIFMPVRNGYEVCEYVKKDSRFSHLPVVLLVGAFDPLDEREAQRVGADGILKKPFVPPDPLITMIKTLLDRTLGERLVVVSAAKPALAVAAKPAVAAITDEHPPKPEAPEELPLQEFAPPADRVTFQEGEHPVAFGQLLETPAKPAVESSTDVVEPVDNDLVLTSARDATLGDPIFWRNDAPESEPESETPEDEDSESLDLRTWKQGENSLPRRDEVSLLQPMEPLELVREEQDEASQASVSSQSILLDQAAQAPLTVDSDVAPELAANPIEWMASAPAEHLEEPLEAAPRWDEPLPEATDIIGKAESPDYKQVASPTTLPASDHISVPVASSVSTHPETIPEDKTAEQSKIEVTPATPWTVDEKVSVPDASPVSAQPEIKPTDKTPEPNKILYTPPTFSTVPERVSVPVASTVSEQPAAKPEDKTAEPSKTQVTPSTSWSVSERASAPVASSVSMQPETKPTDKTPEVSKTQPSLRPIVQSVEDTAHSIPKYDWADLTAALPPLANEPAPPQVKPVSQLAAPVPVVTAGNAAPAPVGPAPASAPDAALVEAVVQRVMDKMRPQVVDIITKEFLRPIVQALVNREIEKH